MKKMPLVLLLAIGLKSGAQSVFGYWYGTACVKTSSSVSNYMV